MLSKQERRKLNGYQFVQSNISLLLIVTINELPLRLGYSYRVTLYTGISLFLGIVAAELYSLNTGKIIDFKPVKKLREKQKKEWGIKNGGEARKVTS